MPAFDRSTTYQFSLFLNEAEPVDPDSVLKLGKLLDRTVEGVPSLGLRLGPAESENGFSVQGRGALVPVTMLSWKAGSGIWRVVLAPARLDVHFDAKGFADITDSKNVETLERVTNRILPNFTEVPDLLGTPVHRLALIVQAQRGVVDSIQASSFVAKHFLNASLCEEAERGDVSDVVVRVNHAAPWRLGEADVLTNRFETATLQSVFRGTTEEITLAWQLDVNTKPRDPSSRFAGSDLREFFVKAQEWAQARLHAVSGGAL